MYMIFLNNNSIQQNDVSNLRMFAYKMFVFFNSKALIVLIICFSCEECITRCENDIQWFKMALIPIKLGCV